MHRLSIFAQQLSIVSRHQARLQLNGRLELDEPVEYEITDTGDLSFVLTSATKRLLRRFRTSLDAAAYDGDSDTAHVIVWPPLPLSVRIKLQRVKERQIIYGSVSSLLKELPWQKRRDAGKVAAA